MVVRVKLRVKCLRSGREILTSALVNSGYEADLIELGTAGGPVRNYLIPRIAEVYVEAGDRRVGPVISDIVISHFEYEVLISDKLGGELGIVILDLRGKWRFKDEDKVRETVSPQYWY